MAAGIAPSALRAAIVAMPAVLIVLFAGQVATYALTCRTWIVMPAGVSDLDSAASRSELTLRVPDKPSRHTIVRMRRDKVKCSACDTRSHSECDRWIRDSRAFVLLGQVPHQHVTVIPARDNSFAGKRCHCLYCAVMLAQHDRCSPRSGWIP